MKNPNQTLHSPFSFMVLVIPLENHLITSYIEQSLNQRGTRKGVNLGCDYFNGLGANQ